MDPTSDGQFTYGRSPSGRLISQTDGTTSLLAGLDAHGDLSFLYTAAGVVSDTAVYDPFGDPAAQTGSTSPTLGFQADFTDPISEHVWMGARWYDGGWAAFLSRDTYFGELKTPISLNRYTYGHANPVRYFDPDGHAVLEYDDDYQSSGGAPPVVTQEALDDQADWKRQSAEADRWEAMDDAYDDYVPSDQTANPETASYAFEEVATINSDRGNQRQKTFPDGEPLPPDWENMTGPERAKEMRDHLPPELGRSTDAYDGTTLDQYFYAEASLCVFYCLGVARHGSEWSGVTGLAGLGFSVDLGYRNVTPDEVAIVEGKTYSNSVTIEAEGLVGAWGEQGWTGAQDEDGEWETWTGGGVAFGSPGVQYGPSFSFATYDKRKGGWLRWFD